MIKQIQLRGISRTPSDRMSADGGCAESLNVQIEEQELCPMIAPTNVTGERMGVDYSLRSPVFIHKTQGLENYFLLGTDGHVFVSVEGKAHRDMGAVLGNEEYRFASAMGNLVNLVTDTHNHYFFFKDGDYVYLGTRIAEPVCDFEYQCEEVEETFALSDEVKAGAGNALRALVKSLKECSMTSEMSDLIEKGIDDPFYEKNGETVKAGILELEELLWNKVVMKQTKIRSERKSIFPHFLRCALRMYDGSYIYQSVPELVGMTEAGTGIETWFSRTGVSGDIVLHVKYNMIHSCSYRMKMDNAGEWKDMIQGAVIAESEDVMVPAVNAHLKKTTIAHSGVALHFGKDGVETAKDIEEAMVASANFYIVDEVGISELSSTYGPSITLKAYSRDELVVKTRLTDDENSHHDLVAKSDTMQYNGRTVMSGAKSLLSPGPRFMPCKIREQEGVRMMFFIDGGTDGVKKVVARNGDGGLDFDHLPQCWLFYPDARCSKVEFSFPFADGYVRYSVPMKSHPLLNGSYAFSHPSTSIDNYRQGVMPTGEGQITLEEEDRTLDESRKVFMSEVSNPFIFPSANRRTFGEEIVSIATTTKALSEGQFGQYPLYVFTKGGIWAVSIANDGTMLTSSPMSREVAESPKSITAIDDAVVFVSRNGVKMVQGSSVADISPNMLGEHFCLDGDNDLGGVVYGAIGSCDKFSDLVLCLKENVPFMEFMKDSSCVYDYNGKRLVFFNAVHPYQYVFSLASQTWHKMRAELLRGTETIRVLNSYPESLVSAKYIRRDGGMQIKVYGLFDIGSTLDLTRTQTALPGIVITRAMDFDNDNVRKIIRDIKLRGHYGKGNARYILMASNDGMRYRVLTSLQGCSYNLFRLVVLLNMTPTERFSYIDIDYETRFTDKLR